MLSEPCACAVRRTCSSRKKDIHTTNNEHGKLLITASAKHKKRLDAWMAIMRVRVAFVSLWINVVQWIEIILRPLTTMGRFCLWGRLARAQCEDAAHETAAVFFRIYIFFFLVSCSCLSNKIVAE